MRHKFSGLGTGVGDEPRGAVHNAVLAQLTPPRLRLLAGGRFFDGWLANSGYVRVWNSPGRLVLRLALPPGAAKTRLVFRAPGVSRTVEVAPGAVHVPGWLDLEEQRALVDLCREWMRSPGGMTRHRTRGGTMSVAMTSLGWYWRPYRYSATLPDGARVQVVAPPGGAVTSKVPRSASANSPVTFQRWAPSSSNVTVAT